MGVRPGGKGACADRSHLTLASTLLSGVPNDWEHNYQDRKPGNKYPSPVNVTLGGNITWKDVTGGRVLVHACKCVRAAAIPTAFMTPHHTHPPTHAAGMYHTCGLLSNGTGALSAGLGEGGRRGGEDVIRAQMRLTAFSSPFPAKCKISLLLGAMAVWADWQRQ